MKARITLVLQSRTSQNSSTQPNTQLIHGRNSYPGFDRQHKERRKNMAPATWSSVVDLSRVIIAGILFPPISPVSAHRPRAALPMPCDSIVQTNSSLC
ncbi:hypothetical protein VTN00DRAFT_5481 [Thermoascus crustaceus]|uniref:uncharacterized protein n=1 Tax=Thermoascus crustaceus TaxID=5088 RepID=UPI003743ACF4